MTISSCGDGSLARQFGVAGEGVWKSQGSVYC
ncbi:hypothetical protein SSAG_00377 [Streptomyces sp. Mg1]|nr:hypothetical protein SSAG_00377 [Streptomyces sp. Mg1]